MPNISVLVAVVYYRGHGHTPKNAEAVAIGVAQVTYRLALGRAMENTM